MYVIINIDQEQPPTYDNTNVFAVGHVAQSLGYRPVTEDAMLSDPLLCVSRRVTALSRPTGHPLYTAGADSRYHWRLCVLSRTTHRALRIVPREGQQLDPPHQTRVADIVSRFSFHAAEEGPEYAIPDYCINGMKQLAQSVWGRYRPYCVQCNAL